MMTHGSRNTASPVLPKKCCRVAPMAAL
jgi:hypothetical protein